MDELTTGMDPINRRHVWDVVRLSVLDEVFDCKDLLNPKQVEAAKHRTIVLTMHSMEKADTLESQWRLHHGQGSTWP